MVNNKPLLSICIPTYNRDIQIQTQVRKILPQLTDNVQLVVYDNCSSNSVNCLFSDEEKERFTIIRHNVNIGADANIAKCFECCSTKWLWTLSDDDYVLRDGVEKVLRYIKDNEDATFINLWSHNYGRVYGFDNLNKVLTNPYAFSSSFAMSMCLYNIESLKNDFIYYYKYLSSMFAPLILVAKSIERTENYCLFVDDAPVEPCSDVGWNYETYIDFSSLIRYAFKDSRNVKNGILLGYHKLNYILVRLNRKSSNIGYWRRYKVFWKVVCNQGVINSFIYSPKQLLKTFIFVLLNISK